MDAIAAYWATRSGEDPRAMATDILADLQLWRMAQKLDFRRCLNPAKMPAVVELAKERS
jgi:hypothetical protein